MKKFMIVLTLACGLCAAQGGDTAKEPAKFYRLDFVVRDLDGNKAGEFPQLFDDRVEPDRRTNPGWKQGAACKPNFNQRLYDNSYDL